MRRSLAACLALVTLSVGAQPADAGSPDPSAQTPGPADAGVAPSPDEGASGQSPPSGAAGAEDAPSEADLAAIEAALGADVEAASETQPPPAQNPVARVLQSMNPDLAFIADIAAAWFSSGEPLQTGGHDPTQRGFNLQQLELSIGSAVDPYFRFDANIVFAQFSVEIEEVYATTLALPFGLQARVGQFLTRFGRINNTHPHSWHFVDQPFAVGRVFGGEGNRGLGAEASWISPLPWYLEVVGSVTNPTGGATARSFLGGSGLEIEHPLDFQFTAAVKQFFDLSDTWSVLVGVSGANGPNPYGRLNRTDVYGVDLYLKYRPVSSADPTVIALQSEWFLRRRQVPADLLSDVNGYAYAFWRFQQRWAVAARYEYGSPAWTLVTGHAGEDLLDPDWTAPRHRVSANLTFWPTEFSRLRLQSAYDLPRWREQGDLSVFLALEFMVGAHGAHTF